MEQVPEQIGAEYFSVAKSLIAWRVQTNSSWSADKPDPVKLEFANKESKWEVLKKEDAELRSQQLYCKLD